MVVECVLHLIRLYFIIYNNISIKRIIRSQNADKTEACEEFCKTENDIETDMYVYARKRLMLTNNLCSKL